MKFIVKFLTFVALLLPFDSEAQSQGAQSQGEELFSSKGCIACHTVGGGRLLGPDLKNIDQRRDEKWLIKFITSPKAMI